MHDQIEIHHVQSLHTSVNDILFCSLLQIICRTLQTLVDKLPPPLLHGGFNLIITCNHCDPYAEKKDQQPLGQYTTCRSNFLQISQCLFSQ